MHLDEISQEGGTIAETARISASALLLCDLLNRSAFAKNVVSGAVGDDGPLYVYVQQVLADFHRRGERHGGYDRSFDMLSGV